MDSGALYEHAREREAARAHQPPSRAASHRSPESRELALSFGLRLSEDVDLHADAAADAVARECDATAVTRGRDVYFRSGAYRPDRPEGRLLLAHELAHVVQQRSTPPVAGVGREGDAHERAASAAAARAVVGLSPQLAAVPGSPRAVQRQQATSQDVTLQGFTITGHALNGQQLGPHGVGTLMVYGVELRFALNTAPQRYTDLQPRQWAGPDAVWIKRGDPLTTPWISVSRGPGSGPDDPLGPSITREPARIAYFDSPGPDLIGHAAARAGRSSRVYTVQNFTGWIEGTPTGGGPRQAISPVVGWYAILDLVDENWSEPTKPANYISRSGSSAGTGWRPTDAPSV